MLHKISVGVYSVIPEGRLKHAIRAAAVRATGELSKRAFVNRSDTVVQVGTPSIGMVRYLLELVGPQGRVIVVEPERDNFNNLSGDSVIASSPNVVLLNEGAWSQRGKLSLTVSKDSADHKVAVPNILHDNDLVPENYVSTQEVDVDTLDNILTRLDCARVDFVEVMVNGAELEVLKGMERTLERGVRIRMKGHAKDLASGEDIGRQILSILVSKGYRAVRARPTAARKEAVTWGLRAGDIYAAKCKFGSARNA